MVADVVARVEPEVTGAAWGVVVADKPAVWVEDVAVPVVDGRLTQAVFLRDWTPTKTVFWIQANSKGRHSF